MMNMEIYDNGGTDGHDVAMRKRIRTQGASMAEDGGNNEGRT